MLCTLFASFCVIKSNITLLKEVMKKLGDKFMKKTTLLSVLIPVVAVLLFLLKATGLTVHIVLSVVGLALLVAYTVATKKEWKKPALEILMRLFYAIALITGVVIMNVSGLAIVAIAHKVCAALFAVLYVLLFALKAKSNAK